MPLSKETHILIVDDDEDDFLIIADYLNDIGAPNLHMTWASTYDEGLKHICEGKFSLTLVDYFLGIKTGLDFIEEAIRLECEGPIILLTGRGDHAIDRKAMSLGAADYLIKSELDAEKLERSIRYALGHYASMKALRASERKYKNVFERSKDSVFIADLSLNFKDVNQAMSELLGIDRLQLKEHSLYEFIVDGKGALKSKIEASGHVDDMEIVVRNAQQENKFCIISISVQEDHYEDPFAHGIIHDISSIKKAERATLRAEKLAAAGRLIRTLAHEVRNPLNNIQISIEQLVTTHKNDENALFLDIIKRNSKRISDQISELLASSHPTEMQMQNVSLQDILDDSIDAANDRITLKGVRVNRRFPEKSCHVIADPNQLKLAFLNIIINAIEAMRERGGELGVMIKDSAPAYSVEISDNGCGIPQKNISQLFEPYFTSKLNGTGMGLAATYVILQAHNASIDVTSREGYGTTFNITLVNSR